MPEQKGQDDPDGQRDQSDDPGEVELVRIRKREDRPDNQGLTMWRITAQTRHPHERERPNPADRPPEESPEQSPNQQPSHENPDDPGPIEIVPLIRER
jgi:hypothetical protein